MLKVGKKVSTTSGRNRCRGGSLAGTQRQGKSECAPPTRRASYYNRTVMSLDDAFGDGQPQPRSFALPALCLTVDLGEFIENALPVPGRNADTSIADRDLD